MPDIGLLILQGGFARHEEALKAVGASVRPVRYPKDLEGLAGIVLPGGESTTQGMLLERHGLLEPLRAAISEGLAVFGTCAGAILLARDIEGSDQARLGNLDITVVRNAYGSQVDSFEARVRIADAAHQIEDEIDAVFIRAPVFSRIGPDVEVLASFDGKPVMVRQGKILAAAFHPELTRDRAIHRWFVERICSGVSHTLNADS